MTFLGCAFTHIAQVALKVLDLDRLPQKALKLLTQETQLMSLSKHPNVLRVSTILTEALLLMPTRSVRCEDLGSWATNSTLRCG